MAVVDLFERTMAEDKVQLANLGLGLKSRRDQPGQDHFFVGSERR